VDNVAPSPGPIRVGTSEHAYGLLRTRGKYTENGSLDAAIDTVWFCEAKQSIKEIEKMILEKLIFAISL
jgi:hypothetical protein